MSTPDPNDTTVDPSQPVYPLRSTRVYPVPPVCTAIWTDEDWERAGHTITEPEEIPTAWGPARAVGRNAAGVLLYRIPVTPNEDKP